MKRVRWFCYLTMICLLVGGIQKPSALNPTAAAAPPDQKITAVPLYRLYKYQLDPNPPKDARTVAPGLHFYTADLKERDNALNYHRYRDEGIAGYVLPQKAYKTVPLFRLSSVTRTPSGNPITTKHFYTTDTAERDKLVGWGWNFDTVAGYVASPNNPLTGTTPLHRLYHPMSEYKGKPGSFETGDDDHLYTTDEDEKARAVTEQKYQSQGVCCYLWSSPAAVALNAPAALMPDLIVKSTTVKGNVFTAVIKNQGTKAVTSMPGVHAGLVLYDKAGKMVFSQPQKVGGMSPGQQTPVTFNTGDFNLRGTRYKVQVDYAELIAESNENNNETALQVAGRNLVLSPLPADIVQPPYFRLTAIQASPSASQPKRAIYKLDVLNWEKFKAEWFQSTENMLPPNPCGGGNTNARLIARLFVMRNGPPIPLGCKPLNSQQDLRTLEFALPVQLGNADKIKIAVVDTALDAKYESQPYPVGVFGVGKILIGSGCQSFLNREGSFICATDQGMSACESLRAKGKPIECRRKPQ